MRANVDEAGDLGVGESTYEGIGLEAFVAEAVDAADTLEACSENGRLSNWSVHSPAAPAQNDLSWSAFRRNVAELLEVAPTAVPAASSSH